ncbi:MAG TPA: hypothetical protein VIM73_20010 [Polyangiaceae bacterium]
MDRRDKLVRFIQKTVDAGFDAERHELGPLLDSVSLLQLIAFIDQELGVPLDLPSLRLEMFATVDSVLRLVEGEPGRLTVGPAVLER